MKKQTPKQIPLTYEAMMAFIYENERFLTEKQAETDRILSEKFAETERIFKEQNAEYDRQRKENERYLNEKFAETAERMKELQQTVGGWSNSHGFFAEEFFINSFKKGEKNFLGEKFDAIKPNMKGFKNDDEYDILLINGKSVGLVETKFKLRQKHLPKILRKPETFRENFPEYAHLKAYLGVAALTFDHVAEQECIDNGIAIIKQVGDTVVIHDEHLKVF